MENAASACNLHHQRPKERWFGRSAALRKNIAWPNSTHKIPDTGRQTTQIKKNRTKGETSDRVQMRGEALRRTSTACKGDQTKSGQRHSQAVYKDLDYGAQERTQIRQMRGQRPHKDHRPDTELTTIQPPGQRGQTTSGQREERRTHGGHRAGKV